MPGLVGMKNLSCFVCRPGSVASKVSVSPLENLFLGERLAGAMYCFLPPLRNDLFLSKQFCEGASAWQTPGSFAQGPVDAAPVFRASPRNVTRRVSRILARGLTVNLGPGENLFDCEGICVHGC